MKQVYRVYHREELVASFDDPISATAYIAEFSTPQYLLKGVPLQVEEPEELGLTIRIKNSSKTASDIPQIILDFIARYQAKEIELDGNTLWFIVDGSKLKPCYAELHNMRIPTNVVYYAESGAMNEYAFAVKLFPIDGDRGLW